jgi:RNA polymerase primary sigma factor
MNAQLKRKCDKLITQTENGILIYGNIINEIAKNKDLLRYSTTIPNAMSYIRSNGITIIMPEVIETAETNELLDSEVIIADGLSEDAIEEDDIAPTDDELREIESEPDTYYDNDDVKQYLRDIAALHDRLLTAEEEKELAIQYRNGDNNAKNTLIEYNLKLVISIAKHYMFVCNTSIISFNDLIQNGNLGLISAVDKFDPDRGFKFSTYATWWIKRSIMKALTNDGRTVRLPVHAIDQLRYIHRAIKELQNESSSENLPEYTDIAALCNENGWVIKTSSNNKKIITPEKVKDYLQYSDMTSTVSLSIPVGEDDDSNLGDFIPDLTQNIENDAENRDMAEKFEYIFNKYLTPREAEILRMRFGFNGRDCMTLDEISKVYGVSRERIRQIEFKAKLKIKKKY